MLKVFAPNRDQTFTPRFSGRIPNDYAIQELLDQNGFLRDFV